MSSPENYPQPFMPQVDLWPTDKMVEKFNQSHGISLGESGAQIPGHKSGQHYVALLTPGRMVRPIPAPPPDTMAPQFVQSIVALLPPPSKRVVAVGFTANLIQADNKVIGATVPFFGFLLGFAYIGHSVVLYEGHPSAFEASVRGVDMLLVDADMEPFLPDHWTETAFRDMRTPNVNVYNRKNPQSSLVQRVIDPVNNPFNRRPSAT